MGIVMMFRCPETGHEVSTGIVRENRSAHPSNAKVEVKCLECGHVHVWDTTQSRLITSGELLDLPIPARIA